MVVYEMFHRSLESTASYQEIEVVCLMEPLAVSSLCLYTLIYQGSIGMAVTLAFADLGGGWERDHPPVSRRALGLLLPFLVLLALLVPFAEAWRHRVSWLAPSWVGLSMLALVPFFILSAGWASAWWRRSPALLRRKWGSGVVQAGLVAMLLYTVFLMFFCERPIWRSAPVLGLIFSSAGILGSLGALAIAAMPTARERSEIVATVPAAILRGALLLSFLVMTDLLFSGHWYEVGAGAGRLLLVWVVAGILAPAVLGYLALPRWPERPWVWPLALGMAALGQWCAHHLMFLFGQLAPPVQPW